MDTFEETEDGYEVTGEEGFVAVDRMGNALKLVDRLEFSRINFRTGKPQDKYIMEEDFKTEMYATYRYRDK